MVWAFYSAFMVSDTVEIDTKSFKGQDAVHWSCDGGTEYDMTASDREAIGTEITLNLNEDCLEFANEYKIRDILDKYCSFMPIPIYLVDEDKGQLTEDVAEEDVLETDKLIRTFVKDAVTREEKDENGEPKTVEVEPAKKMATIEKRPVMLNDIHPLWTKHPNECSDEDYKEFYTKVFHDYKEPLFGFT